MLGSKQDRAKMDVFVTSRHKAVPCLEWSKQTSRQDPVIGVGDTGYNAVLKRAREDPAGTLVPVADTIDLQAAERHLARHTPSPDFEHSAPRGCGSAGLLAQARGPLQTADVSVLSTHVRPSMGVLNMGRVCGRYPPPVACRSRPAGLAAGGSAHEAQGAAADAPAPEADDAASHPGHDVHSSHGSLQNSAFDLISGATLRNGTVSPRGHVSMRTMTGRDAIVPHGGESVVSRILFQRNPFGPERTRGPGSTAPAAAGGGGGGGAAGDGSRVPKRRLQDIHPNFKATSKWRRTTGADFWRTGGRCSPVVFATGPDAAFYSNRVTNKLTQRPPGLAATSPRDPRLTPAAQPADTGAHHQASAAANSGTPQQADQRVPDASSRETAASGGLGRAGSFQGDVSYAGIDKSVKSVVFTKPKRHKDAVGPYLSNERLEPLCTRWNGMIQQPSYDDAGQCATKAKKPCIAMRRAMLTGQASSIIKAASAQLSVVRSTLLRHAREGDCKKKERLASYQANPRLAHRELSPLFTLSYVPSTSATPTPGPASH